MAKTTKDQIKQDEIKILDALEQYSKDKIDLIAKSCGFSRQKTWRIIKNLEKNKVIWGYPPVTDEEARNLKHFTLLVKRNPIVFDNLIRKEVAHEKIDDKIKGLARIENIYTTHGIADMIFTFYAPDILSAKQFIQHLLQRHPIHIKEYFLLETLVQMRKEGMKNPKMKELAEII